MKNINCDLYIFKIKYILKSGKKKNYDEICGKRLHKNLVVHENNEKEYLVEHVEDD